VRVSPGDAGAYTYGLSHQQQGRLREWLFCHLCTIMYYGTSFTLKVDPHICEDASRFAPSKCIQVLCLPPMVAPVKPPSWVSHEEQRACTLSISGACQQRSDLNRWNNVHQTWRCRYSLQLLWRSTGHIAACCTAQLPLCGCRRWQQVR